MILPVVYDIVDELILRLPFLKMFVPFSYFSVKTTLGQSLGKLNFCLNFLKEENERNFFCKQLDLKKRVYPSIESTDT